MKWSTPKDLQAQLARRWDKGDLLRQAIRPTPLIPLRLSLKSPSATDISTDFPAARAWVAALEQTPALRLVWQTLHPRLLGPQAVPVEAWVDELDVALRWLDKSTEWAHFKTLVDLTRHLRPTLLPWLEKRPQQALALAPIWRQLLAVVTWVAQHPRPQCYLRQVDLPGIPSKFIEAHRSVLTELLDLALPAAAIDPGHTGIAGFAARYGFLEKPVRIRCRLLDPAQTLLPGTQCPDLSLDAENFARLRLQVERVLITENETNFLALPPQTGALALFGAGYGWQALAKAQWLQDCQIHYWGDIDTHGFAILDQLRQHFPHARAWLMDRATLEAHRPYWGVEDKPQHADLTRLTPEEQALYDDLRHHRLQANLRLEQEHIGYQWVVDSLDG